MPRATRRLAERVEDLRPGDRYLDTVKSRLHPKVSGLVGLEQEIMREAAASLGRQGERLETALRAMKELEIEFARAPSDALIAAHQAERLEAERVLYHLKIQREALGLRNHRELERRYVVPGRLQKPR